MEKLSEQQMVKALNEWMRRYIDEPERFKKELATVRDFLKDEAVGKEPSYGEEGAAYMLKITSELEQAA